MEYIWYNQKGDISILNGCSRKLVDKFTYLRSSVSLTENDISMWLAKAWIAIGRLSIRWKSNLSDKIRCNLFQAVFVSILLYWCTQWTLIKRIEKKLDGNCIRRLWDILNKSLEQHSTKQQQYGQLPPISKTIQIRRTRHAEHFCTSKNEFISDGSLHKKEQLKSI